jgi:hypothetical protein
MVMVIKGMVKCGDQTIEQVTTVLVQKTEQVMAAEVVLVIVMVLDQKEAAENN